MIYRSKEDKKLGDVIRELIQAYHLSDKLNEVDVRKIWKELLGSVVDQHTIKLYINKHKLFVRVDSAALRNELTMLRTRLTGDINKRIGRSIIDEVVIL